MAQGREVVTDLVQQPFTVATSSGPHVGERDVITIATAYGPETILADVYGDWAAHEAHEARLGMNVDGWVVTHVPSGRCLRSEIGVVVWAHEADIIARVLAAQVPAPTEQAARAAADRIRAICRGALSLVKA